MIALLVGAQIVVLVALVAVSVWGQKHIAHGTRTRARVGATGFDYTKSKSTTLIYAPIVGLLVVGSTIAVRDSDTPETVAGIGLAIMVIYLLAHWSTVKRAAR